VGKATARGSIYRVDFYPAYKPEPDGEVHGEIYRLNDSKTLAELDDYEGDGFERVKTETSQGDAWVYQYRGQPPAEARIASGDFCAA
jgi:gamma-glutamylcyclotransferase (GGCT)/AIG2-like uncharacterized protein YtfP